MTREPLLGELRSVLVRADSVTSFVAHRHTADLADDLRQELLEVSIECRKLGNAAKDRDALAVLLAERWWPERYIGDLSEQDWRTVYDALEKPEAA